MNTAADEAIQFLVSRIAEQARTEEVQVNKDELAQLTFSEDTASEAEIDSAAEFDSTHDVDEFEGKIANLLRNAFRSDVQQGRRAFWDRSLAALAEIDVYVLVMVDMAGIGRTNRLLS